MTLTWIDVLQIARDLIYTLRRLIIDLILHQLQRALALHMVTRRNRIIDLYRRTVVKTSLVPRCMRSITHNALVIIVTGNVLGFGLNRPTVHLPHLSF